MSPKPGKKKKESMALDKEGNKETVQQVLQYPCLAWGHIRKETMEYFGCRTRIDERTGDINAIYFPCYSKSGDRVIGYQKKDLDIPKEGDFHFTNVGTVRVSCPMYGQKQAPPKGPRVWVTEGWKDLLITYQALKDNTRGTQWADRDPPVVSIIEGAPKAGVSAGNNIEFLQNFDQIIICMDNDSRSPFEKSSVIRGKEATDLIGSYLFSTGKDLRVPDYPEDINDLYEFFDKNGHKPFIDLVLWNHTAFKSEKIITFDDVMSFEESVAPVEKGIMTGVFPMMDEMLGGLRLHEMTTITGLSNVGKSFLAFEIMYQIAAQGNKVGLIMLEDPIMKTQRRIASRYLEINPKYYKMNPREFASEEKLKEAWEFSTDPETWLILNHFGSMRSDVLMSKVKALTAQGCQYILLDHATMVVSGLDTQNERKDLDVLYTDSAAFRAAHPVHLLYVSHVDKKAGPQDTQRPSEPKWHRIHPSSLRGSAGLWQISCNIIMLHNEILPDGRRGRVQIGIGKNREGGELGDADIVKTNENGLFVDASKDIWTPKTQGY